MIQGFLSADEMMAKWNVPAGYEAIIGFETFNNYFIAVFRRDNFGVDIGEFSEVCLYTGLPRWLSRDDFEYIEPYCYSSLGECLEAMPVVCGSAITFDEFRDVVLYNLGGDGAVSAFRSGVPLSDVFAGW